MRATVHATDLAQPPGVRFSDYGEVAFVVDGTDVWIDAGDQLDKLTRLHAWAASLAEETASAISQVTDRHGYFEVEAEPPSSDDWDAAHRLADRAADMAPPTVLEPVDADGCDAVTAQLVDDMCALIDGVGQEAIDSRANAIKARVATLLANR